MITTIFRVHVDVPELVWRYFRDDNLYFCEMCGAFEGNVASGTNHYDNVEEWAEFTDSSVAISAEAKAKALMLKYAQLAEQLAKADEEADRE